MPRNDSFLIDEAKIGVDGVEMSGTSAMMHAISIKPYTDPDFAQILYDAGAEINRGNRYGCTVASDIVQQFSPNPKATAMLKWFVDHGEDVDIRDGDGMTARFIVNSLEAMVPDMAAVLAKRSSSRPPATGSGSDSTVEIVPCKVCGKNKDAKKCVRCKTVAYCGKEHQKADWKAHKKICASMANSRQEI